MKLTKPIKPGFRRPFTITADEPVENPVVEVLSGDSTITFGETNTDTVLSGWINGDGSLGDKSVRVTADGHIGEGEVAIEIVFDFTVAHPDATALTAVFGEDEAIPAR